MGNPRFRYGLMILLGVGIALGGSPARGAYLQKSLTSLAVPEQGILPGSRITEALRLTIVESETDPEDGGLTVHSLRVGFDRLNGTELSELYTVALYRIGQEVDAANFDMQRDFDFRLNRLIGRARVDGRSSILFDQLEERVENSVGIFFITVSTDVTLDNNDEFAVVVSDVVTEHDAPGEADPNPDLSARSEVLTCVDFAGDLMPQADFVRGTGFERDFPFSPHNYPDFRYQHPDALNSLYDLEIPAVLPAESEPTAVFGIEMAGVRSQLMAVRLNFTSSIDGINDDGDSFIDEDLVVDIGGILYEVSRRGVFDPFIDEIVRDNDGDGLFSVGDEVLFVGYNGILDAEQAGVDDDADGTIDEEQVNGFKLDPDQFPIYMVNEDRDWYLNNDTKARYSPGIDQFYRDLDGDGFYTGGSGLDVLVDTDGLDSGLTGAAADGLAEGDPLTQFASGTKVAFADRGGGVGEFDLGTDVLLYDHDGNGVVTVQVDTLIDVDGNLSRGVGAEQFKDIEAGDLGRSIQVGDRLFADNFTSPVVIWQDAFPFNGIYDGDDYLVLGDPPSATASFTNVGEADPLNWYYLDKNGNHSYNATSGEDLYINATLTDPQYSETAEVFAPLDLAQAQPAVLYAASPSAQLTEGEVLISAAATGSLLVFNDSNENGGYDEGEDIVREAFSGGLTYSTTSEGIDDGTASGFSLTSGDSYLASALPLIDEDHGYTVLQPLVDEDLQNRVAWIDEDGNGVFSVTDLDGDGDFFPFDEDLNGNGILDRIDNNGDGDYDDQDDYNEDLNGDGNHDLGLSGDEIYIDYDGDGRFDPNVGGQLHTVSELFFEGSTPGAQLRAGDAYDQFLEVDEDGDGEIGTLTLDSRLGIVLGLFPNRPPFTQGLAIQMADGVDNDGDSEDPDGDGYPTGQELLHGTYHGDARFSSTCPAFPPGQDGNLTAAGESYPDPRLFAALPATLWVDEGINEDPGDSAFDASTFYNLDDNDFSNDIWVSDIERIEIYRDNAANRNGRFDPDEDTRITRHDPEIISWQWIDTTPPVYTAEIYVSLETADEDEQRELRQLPITDDANYDFFVVVHTDGDDNADQFADYGGAEIADGLGLRHGDDFQVSLARDGIIVQTRSGDVAGKPNAKQIGKPIESILHLDDMIGFVSSSVQGDDDRDSFIGNPYFDSTSSPIAVLGLNVANHPVPRWDGSFENDVLEQVRVHLQNVASDEVSGASSEGGFDVVLQDGVVTLPDLMPLADDSSGGVGIYRDDDTPEGDGLDDDGDGRIDEELLNGIDDDGDGLIDEDVGDDDPAGINGVFDPYDDPLPLRNDTGSPLSYRLESGVPDAAFVDLNLISGSFASPDDLSSFARGYDYYVVLRTSDEVDYRDTWRVFINDQDVRFRGGRSAMNTGARTDSIAANLPVVLADLTRPEPGSLVQTIQANSEPTAVVALNLFDRNLTDSGQPASLEYIRVTVDNVPDASGVIDHDFTPSDLLPISTVEDLNGNGVFDAGEFDWNGDGVPNSGRDSGVALYRDSTDPGGKPGVFDDTDELVYLDGDETFGNLFGFPNTVQLNLDRFGDEDGERYERLPADDEGDDEGADYFVVIRTSSALSNGDDFRVRVSPVAANDVVEWPMHFQPVEFNGVFPYTYSYEAITTQVLRANTQTDAVFQNLVAIGQRIEADSMPTAVLGVNINDSGDDPPRRLNQARVRIYPGEAGDTGDDVASGFEVSDLNPFSNTVNSGLAIYRDVDGIGRNGIFDPGLDQRLNQTISSYEPVYDPGSGDLLYVDAVINLSPGSDLPNDELGENVGPDYFVVIRTSRSISFEDQFSVQIPQDGLFFESGESLGNRSVTTETLTSNVPTFFNDRTVAYGRQVGDNSEPLVAISINMNSGTQGNPAVSNESIVSMVVQFNRENGSAFTNIDIATLLGDSPASGVALYRDDSPAGTPGNGRFNVDEDTYLALVNLPRFDGENEATLVFEPALGETRIPATDEGADFGADFYVVFRTSESITRDSEFSLTVKDIRFETLNSQLYFTTGVVTGGDVNQAPTIELVSPVLGDRASSEPFAVLWEDYDDGEAYINLYYMDEAKFQAQSVWSVEDLLSIPAEDLVLLAGADGGQALGILYSDPANRFEWDVTQVPIGERRVIAIMTDDRQVQSAAYSPGPLTITNELPTFAFTQPNGVGDEVVRGTPYTISWVDSDPENNARIDLFLTTEGGPPPLIELPGGRSLPEDPDGTADSYEVATTDLAAGTYYPVAQISDGVVRDGVAPVLEVVSASPFIVLANMPPELTLLTPDATQSLTVFNGDFFDIEWTDRDDDSNALISLYFDRDRVLPADALPILATNEVASQVIYASGIPEGAGLEGSPEDNPDVFRWDVSEVTAGRYYIFARIDDGVNPPVERYSPGSVVIDKMPFFQFVEPDGVDDVVLQGQTYLLTYMADDPDTEASITLYLDDDQNPDPDSDRGLLISRGQLIDNDGQGVAAYALNTAAIPVVTEETQFYPLALVADGNNTPLFVHAEHPLTIRPNIAPSLTFTRPNLEDSGQVQNDEVFTVQWTDSDPEELNPDAPDITVKLYYDTNQSGIDGVLLEGLYESAQGVYYQADQIPFADEADAFQWDIRAVSAGQYYLYAILDDGLERDVPTVRYSLYPITVNKLPSLAFIEPDGVGDALVAGASYEMVWLDDDPDSNALIDFYLSTSQTLPLTQPPDPALLGTLIAVDIEEDDPVDRLSFSTAGLEADLYYPVAYMRDEANAAQVFVAEHAVEILNNSTPSITLLTPPMTGAVAFETMFEIRWVDANRESGRGDPAFVNLYYDTDERELNGVRINPEPIPQEDTSDLYLWDLAASGIAPGTYYLYATIEDTARRIIFDYSEGPLIVPESGTSFFYGLHILNASGVVTSLDTTPGRTFNLNFELPGAVNVEPNLDGTLLLAVNEVGEVKAAAGGMVLAEATQEALGFERFIDALPSSLPQAGRRIVDLEFDISSRGYYLLDSYGRLYASARVPNPLVVPGPSGLGLFGFDIARDFEITPSARGGYILSGDGGVVPLGDAPVISTPFFGWDIARDLEVVAGGYYLLDGMGGVYAVGEDVRAFSSPHFGVDVGQDLLAIDDGGYFILFQGGNLAVAGDRLNLPSIAETSPIFQTGIPDVVDMALSGDILVFFSQDLIEQSIRRFERAYLEEDAEGIEAELSESYDDGSSIGLAAKMDQFLEYFQDNDITSFVLGGLEITVSDQGDRASVLAQAALSSAEISYTTASAFLERNSVPDYCDFNEPLELVNTRNLLSADILFSLEATQDVTFQRSGKAELFFLYLDRQIGPYGSWEEVAKFGLSTVSTKVFRLLGGEEYLYRVVVVDLSCEDSLLTDPLGIEFGVSSSGLDSSEFPVTFEYVQESPGVWKIVSTSLPAD